MDRQEGLNNIFSLLDLKLREDAYFKELQRIVLRDCGNDFTLELSQALTDFLTLDITYIPTDTCDLKITNNFMYFSVVKDNDAYLVELKESFNEKKISTLLGVTDSLSRVETIEMPLKNGEPIDFICNIYYYVNGIYNPLNVHNEKNAVFSQEFKIPLNLAHYFRINFKKLAPVVLNYKRTKKFIPFEAYLSFQDNCLFLRPFYLEKMEDFINDEFLYEIKGVLEDAFDLKTKQVFIRNLNMVYKTLLSNIGSEGEVVISHNIYQSMLLYLMGYTDKLVTRGMIIRKIDSFYNLYYVSISGDNILVIPQEINMEDARNIYNYNSLNQEVEGLDEFFGITRKR